MKNRAYNKKSRNSFWKKIVAKHDYEVEIIIDNLSESESLKKEIEFIKLYKKFGYCEANFTDGGDGVSGYKHTKKMKLEMSKKLKGNKYNLGNKRSKETKLKMSKKLKGKVRSDETRRKISESKKNITYETRRKMSQARKLVVYSKETREKLRVTTAKRNSKQVIDITTGFCWDSIKEAAEIYNIKRRYLSDCLNNVYYMNKTDLRFVDKLLENKNNQENT
jgi:hypothetical protein